MVHLMRKEGNHEPLRWSRDPFCMCLKTIPKIEGTEGDWEPVCGEQRLVAWAKRREAAQGIVLRQGGEYFSCVACPEVTKINCYGNKVPAPIRAQS